MKRVAILVAAVAFTLSLNMRVFATGVENSSNTEVNEATVISETVQEDAGILPDSIFYILDKAFDNFRLFLTFDDEKKMEIISQITDERLAESETMTKEEKYELATSAMEQFNNLITKAAGLIEEPAIEEPAIEEPKIEEPKIEKTELQLAKKAAVANMVEKRHELNTARQEYQAVKVAMKKAEKSKDEEAIKLAEEELNAKEILYSEAKEAFYIAFAE
ncbi:MAG: DUF5667 domain-containing protein, partial [Clostridium sp.]